MSFPLVGGHLEVGWSSPVRTGAAPVFLAPTTDDLAQTDLFAFSFSSTSTTPVALTPSPPRQAEKPSQNVTPAPPSVSVSLPPTGSAPMVLFSEGHPLIGEHLLPAVVGQYTVPVKFSLQDVQGHYLVADTGGLSAAGQALCSQLSHKYIDNVPSCSIGTPMLYFTGGLNGSGKGAIIDSMWKDQQDFVLIDSDRIKKDIVADLAVKNPSLRQQMADDPEWNTAVHGTSKLIAHQLVHDALASGKEIIFDSTMCNPENDEYRAFAAEARKNGYLVKGIISQVSVDKAVERATQRAGKPVSVDLPDGQLVLHGRTVRADYIKGNEERLRRNLEAYTQEGLFDRLEVFDNSRDGKPAQLVETYHRVATSSGYTCRR